MTFAEMFTGWHGKQQARWTPHHAADVLYDMKREIFPKLGPLAASQITPEMILEALTPMEMRSPDIAGRLRQRISAAYDYGMGIQSKSGCTTNPAAALRKTLAVPVKGHLPAQTTLEGVRAVLAATDRAAAHPYRPAGAAPLGDHGNPPWRCARRAVV
jgi:hypothetical protein